MCLIDYPTSISFHLDHYIPWMACFHFRSETTSRQSFQWPQERWFERNAGHVLLGRSTLNVKSESKLCRCFCLSTSSFGGLWNRTFDCHRLGVLGERKWTLHDLTNLTPKTVFVKMIGDKLGSSCLILRHCDLGTEISQIKRNLRFRCLYLQLVVGSIWRLKLWTM